MIPAQRLTDRKREAIIQAAIAEILMQLWDSSCNELEVDYRADQPLREQLRTLMQLKMDKFNNASFMDLARVAIAETIHLPERAREMVARLGEREEGVNVWIRAAQADGKLKPIEPAFAPCQLQALLKAFAFWPQITMGQPPLPTEMQQCVVDSAVDMFLAQYVLAEIRRPGGNWGRPLHMACA